MDDETHWDEIIARFEKNLENYSTEEIQEALKILQVPVAQTEENSREVEEVDVEAVMENLEKNLENYETEEIQEALEILMEERDEVDVFDIIQDMREEIKDEML